MVRLLIIISISIVTICFSWVGFTSSDDSYYVSAGIGWLNEFPYVAKNFGTIRAAVALPIALFVAIFGESEVSVTLSTCLFLILSSVLTMIMLGKIIGYTAATIISSGLVTIPLFAIHATIPSADMPELFFVVSSFWVYWIATQRNNRVLFLFIAGILAACAFSAHELTVGLLFFYGLLFLINFGLKRCEYWIMALGFLVVIGVECIYYWALTGDPIYRFNLLLQGVEIHDRLEVKPFQISDSGVLHIWSPIDPLLMFLTCHYFSVIGYLTIPAILWLFKQKLYSNSKSIILMRLLFCLGVVWLLTVGIELRNLKLLPRYYMVTAYCFYIGSAIWLYVRYGATRIKNLSIFLTLFIVINFFLISLNNKNPRFGERALVEYLSNSNELIYTDPLTAHNSEFYARWASQDFKRIIPEPPRPGDLYFFNSKNASNSNRFLTNSELGSYKVNGQFIKIWEKHPPVKPIARILDRFGVLKLLPQSMIDKIEGSSIPVFVYKLPK